MGKLPSCSVCGRPVLELQGQFELLQPYYADAPDPALEIAGWCHSTCLAASEHSAKWIEWQVRHFGGVRGYAVLDDVEGWRVLQSARDGEVLAIGRDGCSLHFAPGVLKRARKCTGGRVVPVRVETMYLELDDLLDPEVEQRLSANGEIPILDVVAALGVADTVRDTEALTRARFTEFRQYDIGRFSIGVDAEYGVFVPEALVAAMYSPAR